YQEDFLILVQKELKNRNIPIEPLINVKNEANEISDEKLRLGEKGNPIWMTICFVMALFGGLYSLAGGYIYYFSKRKTSEGENVYAYDEQTRKYGKWMMIISGIVILICLFRICKTLNIPI
ncbi:MAG: hypothetical protein LBV75_08610, partial [Paludibacter sp.]|nr:hypothetical protein [Paludibacter sp.]